MTTITIPHNFEPRAYQLPFLRAMDSGYKRAVSCWHRRAGKDKTFINFAAKSSMSRVGLYLYLFPTYKQGRKALWNGRDKDGFPHMGHFPDEIREKTNNTEMTIYLKNGSIFQVVGTDDIDSILGSNPLGCVFSEYSLQIPTAWDYLSPILVENDGWAVFNFTPRGRNHAFKLHNMAVSNPRWFVETLTVDDTKMADGTPVMTAEKLQYERDEGKTEAFLQQEYWCSFEASLEQCFFGDSLSRHVQTEPGERGNLEIIEDGNIRFIPAENGILEIWDRPYRLAPDWDGLHWEKRYSVGSDIAEGLMQDYSVAKVYDRQTKEFVARMRSNKIDAHTWGDMLDQLSTYYERAIIVPERTGAGITTCKRLLDLKSNVYFNLIPAKVGPMTKVVGWVQTQEAKYNMAGDLREYFKNTPGRVRDTLLLQECSVFVKKENKKLEADEGFNDDIVVSAGLALQGSIFVAGSPKVLGEAKMKAEKKEADLGKLDTASQAAAKEFEQICEQVKAEQEYVGGRWG